MRIREDTTDRMVLTLTPWAPWIVSCVAGAAFVAFALFDPAGMPGWARAVFGGLGVIVPLGFLASHAVIRAEFSRSRGVVTITRSRPLGGTSRQVIPLDRIEAVEEVVERDVDNTSFHRIELVLGPDGRGHREVTPRRVPLTTAPISIDQSEAAHRVAVWLGMSPA